MTSELLKLIAVLAMLIDHLGCVVFSGTPYYEYCRIIGRLAFPIYAFLITEGYRHTKDVKKYMLRLFIFALISEIPFDMAFFGTFCYLKYQNVFFTLFLGLFILVCIDKKVTNNNYILFAVAALILSEVLHTDYGCFGIVVIMLFYILRYDKKYMIVAITAVLVLYGIAVGFYIEGFGALSLILILNYNGKKGNIKIPKLLFYAIYPAHLLILGLYNMSFFT